MSTVVIQRRAGRRKVAVLEAAGRVISDRGADATRFADVAAESGVPVSTLQYYFGSHRGKLHRGRPQRGQLRQGACDAEQRQQASDRVQDHRRLGLLQLLPAGRAGQHPGYQPGPGPQP